jgi:cytoskeleton protein RodZ
MILHARANCWVEVREKSGRVLLKGVLRRNETWPVPAGLDLLLTTRNAGATELIVNGKTAPPLGPMHAVRRDIPLIPDLIKR